MGGTALHYSIVRLQENSFEALLSFNADLNAKDNEGRTPLHLTLCCYRVAQCNYETYKKIIKTLLKQGAERDSVNNKGDTPLAYLDEMRTSIAQVEIMPGEED